MDDTPLMRRFEGFGDLLGDVEGLVERDRALRDPVRQRRAFDELEDQP